MKLEFLTNGSPDCPLIRIYEFNSKEAYELRRIALQLARGKEAAVLLHEQPNVTTIGNLKLALQQRQKNRGVSEIFPFEFEWVLSQAGWLQVADLIRPFSRGAIESWQWLCKIGKARILLSCDGHW